MISFRHPLLVVILALSGTLTTPAAGADHSDQVPDPLTKPADTAKPINTLDPISGRPITNAGGTCAVIVPGPVTLKEDGPSAKAATVVIIGFSDITDRETVERSDAKTKELYVRAAQQNKIVKAGQITDPDGQPASAATAR